MSSLQSLTNVTHIAHFLHFCSPDSNKLFISDKYIFFWLVKNMHNSTDPFFVLSVAIIICIISNCPLDSDSNFPLMLHHTGLTYKYSYVPLRFFIWHTCTEAQPPRPLYTHTETQAHMSTNTYAATPGYAPRCVHTHTNTHTTTRHTTSVKSLAD